jgi:hypothetical protein
MGRKPGVSSPAVILGRRKRRASIGKAAKEDGAVSLGTGRACHLFRDSELVGWSREKLKIWRARSTSTYQPTA